MSSKRNSVFYMTWTFFNKFRHHHHHHQRGLTNQHTMRFYWQLQAWCRRDDGKRSDWRLLRHQLLYIRAGECMLLKEEQRLALMTVLSVKDVFATGCDGVIDRWFVQSSAKYFFNGF